MILLTDEQINETWIKTSGNDDTRMKALLKAQSLEMWKKLKENYGGWYDGSHYCIEIPKEEFEQIEKELKVMKKKCSYCKGKGKINDFIAEDNCPTITCPKCKGRS